MVGHLKYYLREWIKLYSKVNSWTMLHVFLLSGCIYPVQAKQSIAVLLDITHVYVLNVAYWPSYPNFSLVWFLSSHLSAKFWLLFINRRFLCNIWKTDNDEKTFPFGSIYRHVQGGCIASTHFHASCGLPVSVTKKTAEITDSFLQLF